MVTLINRPLSIPNFIPNRLLIKLQFSNIFIIHKFVSVKI